MESKDKKELIPDEDVGLDEVEILDENGQVIARISKGEVKVVIDGVEKTYDEAYEECFGDKTKHDKEGDSADG